MQLTRTWFSSGDQGWGKSYRLSEIVAERLRENPARRVLVLELAEEAEWPHGVLRGRVRYAIAYSADKAEEALSKGHRIVIVRVGLDTSEPDRPLAVAAGQLADVARRYPGEVVFVLPEAHLAMPSGGWKVPPGLLHLLHRSRKSRVLLALDTQHPAQINVRVRREARWYVHRTTDPDDIDAVLYRVKRTLGPEHVPRVRAALHEIDARGEPGWHIVVDGARSELTPRR